MSSVNGTFFSLVFPRLLFCLLVVRIISTVMSHTFVDVFPSHPSSLFLSPTPSYTDEPNSLSLTHMHTNPFKITSYGAHLFLNKLFYFIILFPTQHCLFCAQCYLCLFCVLEKRKQHFYTIYVNKLLLLQF